MKSARPGLELDADPVKGKPRRDRMDPEVLRRQLVDLESRFTQEDGLSEKLLLQREMGFMRSEQDRDPRGLNVTYPVDPPYAFINIVFDAGRGEYRYNVREPTLTPEEWGTFEDVRRKMEAMTGEDELPMQDISRMEHPPEVVAYLTQKFEEVLELYDIEVPVERRRPFLYYLRRDLLGYGRAAPIFHDPFLEDISCNGHGVPIYVFHRVFGSVRTNVRFETEQELNRYILMLAQTAGKHVSVFQPILDSNLADGSRINLTLGTEVTKKGSTFSIRKFANDPISPVDLIRLRSGSAEMFAYFWQLIESKRSILVSGGTASGKTTLLNAIAMFIKQEDKVVSIEDTPEVHLAHNNWIQSVSRGGYGGGGAIDLFDLLVAALRQRPEFILVGEVRGRESTTLFQAISTGHAAMATIHAANIDELLNRVENEPMNIPRQLFQSLDCVVFPGQVVYQGRRARRIKGVSEVLEVDPSTGNLLTNAPYDWGASDDTHKFGGRSSVLEEIARTTGKTLDDLARELERKRDYLNMMVDRSMSHFEEVVARVNAYAIDPEAAFQAMKAGQ